MRRGHPWVFEQAITRQSHEGSSGDLAVVFDRRRQFLAIGLYDPHSSIRVRILQHSEPVTIDASWFNARMKAAAQLRAPLAEGCAETTTTGYRLVHGEGDGLPGLAIDRYEHAYVVKLYTPAWVPHLRDVLAALQNVSHPERVVLRLGRSALDANSDLYGLSDGQVLCGPNLDGPVLFWENGLRFEADVLRGHKTGFYFDQRDNRARVEGLAAGKSVLNVFSYSGAFSAYAARGGACRVISVDVSEPALEAATRNLERNRCFPGVEAADHQTIVGDAFDVMARMAGDGCSFDLVIVDPPAFATKKAQVAQALAAYQRLTRLSLALLRSDGILVQASCSSRVDAEGFFEAVRRAADGAGRPLQEIERTGHGLDHPVTFREGAYLKCLFAVVP